MYSWQWSTISSLHNVWNLLPFYPVNKLQRTVMSLLLSISVQLRLSELISGKVRWKNNSCLWILAAEDFSQSETEKHFEWTIARGYRIANIYWKWLSKISWFVRGEQIMFLAAEFENPVDLTTTTKTKKFRWLHCGYTVINRRISTFSAVRRIEI